MVKATSEGMEGIAYVTVSDREFTYRLNERIPFHTYIISGGKLFLLLPPIFRFNIFLTVFVFLVKYLYFEKQRE